jgi:predicted Zn-dependent protease
MRVGKFSTFLLLILFLFNSLSAQEKPILRAMEKELQRSMEGLKNAGKEPLFFIQYECLDEERLRLSASLGALTQEDYGRERNLSVDLRVGTPQLDNTHQLRGSYGMGVYEGLTYFVEPIPVEDDEFAIRDAIWRATDREFKKAQERIMKIKAERETKVAEEDPSPDFSPAPKEVFIGDEVRLSLNKAFWISKIRELSKIFKSHPWILSSSISLTATAQNRYIVNSEGTKILEGITRYNLNIYAETKAQDGMRLYLTKPFFSFTEKDLPSEKEILKAIESLINELSSLRNAPLAEPYSGPAILMNRAAGVFFHEIFGHRIEGHRQKLEGEGQTFKDKVGKKVLPDFISVYDDPTMREFRKKALNGHYRYDNEGVRAQRVVVVENGILKNFLMGRSPIQGFPNSNGHGRRQIGYKPVARQGVLFIESQNEIPFEQLKKMLIEECKRQNKPYGLIFEDIAGGFTVTERGFVQAFNVTPLLVKKLYPDGKEEVVRGVNIVGTPLASFSKIIATGNDYEVFNGTCGAESGGVPVSAISPSILTTEIEVEKKIKEQEKPPILPSPLEKK